MFAVISPRVVNISILGLGLSVGTSSSRTTSSSAPPASPTAAPACPAPSCLSEDGVLQAPVVVVHDFDELEAKAAEVAGSIVVFDWQVRLPVNIYASINCQPRACAHMRSFSCVYGGRSQREGSATARWFSTEPWVAPEPRALVHWPASSSQSVCSHTFA